MRPTPSVVTTWTSTPPRFSQLTTSWLQLIDAPRLTVHIGWNPVVTATVVLPQLGVESAHLTMCAQSAPTIFVSDYQR
jgi:hypothetical protein